MNTKKNNKHKSISPESAKEAFDSIKTELDALPETELLTINVDVTNACVTILGAADRLDTLAPEMVCLPGFQKKAILDLRVYALAGLYSNAVATDETAGDLAAEMLEEVYALRGGLLIGADALAHRGLLSLQRVAEIRAGQGHLDAGDDLIGLSALLDEAWEEIHDKTAITREEVDRAAVLGSKVHLAMAARRVANGSRAKDPASLLARARAFTLLVRAYDECRRAASYLRWHFGDIDEYAPSIYAKRKRRATKTEEPTTDLPTTPEPTVVTTPAPESPTPVVG